MAHEQKSSGTRRIEIIQTELRQAADSRDVAGICTAYVRTAHQLLVEFPNMSAQEKQTIYAWLRDDVERLRIRAGQELLECIARTQEDSYLKRATRSLGDAFVRKSDADSLLIPTLKRLVFDPNPIPSRPSHIKPKAKTLDVD